MCDEKRLTAAIARKRGAIVVSKAFAPGKGLAVLANLVAIATKLSHASRRVRCP